MGENKKTMNFISGRILLSTAAALTLFCSFGCVSASPEPVVEVVEVQAEPYLFHTIQHSGETLGLIASWYTGKSANWTAIQDANPKLKPHALKLGTVVRIPAPLLTRYDSLPESVVAKSILANPLPEASVEVSESAPGAEVSSPEQAVEVPEEQSPANVPQNTPPPASERLLHQLVQEEARAEGQDDALQAKAEEEAERLRKLQEEHERERLLEELLRQ